MSISTSKGILFSVESWIYRVTHKGWDFIDNLKILNYEYSKFEVGFLSWT